jgi:hypothetical protein
MVKAREEFIGGITVLDEDGYGSITASGSPIKDAANPTDPQDLVTLSFLLSKISAAGGLPSVLNRDNRTDGYDLEVSFGSVIRGEDGEGLNLVTTSSGNIVLSADGYIDADGNIISNVGDPVAAQDVASKAYVDSQIGASNEWGEVLNNGNTSDGYDVRITDGSEIQFDALNTPVINQDVGGSGTFGATFTVEAQSAPFGGGDLDLLAGTATVGGPGGTVSITGGESSSNDIGGGVAIGCGTGVQRGGSITANGGVGISSGAGGSISLSAGDNTFNNKGASLTLSGARTVSIHGIDAGGNIDMTAGSGRSGGSSGTGAAGDIDITAGDGYTTNDGGDITISAGNALGTGDGGDIILDSGSGVTDGYVILKSDGTEVVRFGTGSLLMQFGDSDDAVIGFPTTSGDGKDLTIAAQNSIGGNGLGGSLALISGEGGVGGGTSVNTGDITIATPDVTSGSSSNSGDIAISTGDGKGSGWAGDVTINGGASTSNSPGSGGNIGIYGGTREGGGGPVCGNVTIAGGDRPGLSNNNPAGAVTITGGDSFTNHKGASVTVGGGISDQAFIPAGGDLDLAAGDSIGNSGDGGFLQATAGNGADAGVSESPGGGDLHWRC